MAVINLFISLKMRTTIYRQLSQYLDQMDAASMNSSKPLCDSSIDSHFRSGIYLGVGGWNRIPGKLMILVELSGYQGDRKIALESSMNGLMGQINLKSALASSNFIRWI